MLRSASPVLLGSGVAVAIVAAALTPALAGACESKTSAARSTAVSCCSKASQVTCVASRPASVPTPVSSAFAPRSASARKVDGATFRSFAVPQNAGETAGAVLVLASPVAGTAGMRVDLDPENGLGRGDVVPSELVGRAAASPSLEVSHEGLVPVTLSDGSLMIDLQGRFQEYSVVRLDAAGKPRITCVQGEERAKSVASQPLPPATPASADK